MTLVDTLKEGARQGQGGAAHGRIRNVLVIGEVALSLTLLIGAALLAETLYNLRSEKLGFDPANVITMTTPGPQVKPLTIARVWGFDRQLLDRIQSLPGVSSAAVVSVAPLTGQGNLPTQVEGYNDSSRSFGGTEVRVVSSRYFETMRIPILQGRGIQQSDAASASFVHLSCYSRETGITNVSFMNEPSRKEKSREKCQIVARYGAPRIRSGSARNYGRWCLLGISRQRAPTGGWRKKELP